MLPGGAYVGARQVRGKAAANMVQVAVQAPVSTGTESEPVRSAPHEGGGFALVRSCILQSVVLRLCITLTYRHRRKATPRANQPRISS
jgi:hypothetical protein